jgi:hypothetical protein
MAKAFALGEGQEWTDITEGVRALYDLVINSMDWSSGFLSAEDAEPVAEVARVMGFEQDAEIQRYADAKRKHEEEAAARVPQLVTDSRGTGVLVNGKALHDIHVYSAYGRCVWPGCDAAGEPEGMAWS